MLLIVLGYAMVETFMVEIMTNRLSAFVALVIVPIVFGLMAGHGSDLGAMAVAGVTKLAPTALLLLCAVLYFGVMIDAGLFDPLVRKVIAAVGGDPMRVVIGTAIVALLVSLDGDGATTVLVTVTAFLPLYRRLGMNPLIIAVMLGSANSVMNLVPWGGPTGRVASALGVDISAVFVPLLPTMPIDAMAKGAVAAMPPALGPWLAPMTALLSAPLTFVLSNDAYYFGVIPVIAHTASAYGVDPVLIARASLLGQPVHVLSPLVAALYLVAGLLETDVGALQRFGLKWASLLVLVLVVSAALTGAIL